MNAPRTEAIVRKRGEIRDHALYELARDLEDAARYAEQVFSAHNECKPHSLGMEKAVERLREAIGANDKAQPRPESGH